MLLPWLLLACAGAEEAPRVRDVRAHVPAGCPEPDRRRWPVELEALGDFPSGPGTRSVLDERSDTELAFPPSTLEVAASVGSGAWLGRGLATPEGHLDLLLWPAAERCVFGAAPQSAYPGHQGGQALGLSADGRTLLVAGGEGEQSDAAGALLLDLGTGSPRSLPGDASLRRRRAGATITAFGDGFLVAGGFDPVLSEGGSPVVHADAELFDPESERFDELPPIELKDARAEHAATVLDDGSSLLVGGVDASGRALVTLERISTETRRSTLAGLATLTVGRKRPTLLRLSDGRIAVAGGELADGSAPVDTVEWLSADASRLTTPPPLSFDARFDRAFVAMPGGGILGVGGCEPRAPGPAEDCAPCRRGCVPEGGFDAVWISPEGVATTLPIEAAAAEPVLIAGSEGAPWLIVGGALYRFNPWRARFEASFTPAELPAPGLSDAEGVWHPLPRPLAVDPGAFVWVSTAEHGPALVGLRHGTRGPFVRDPELLGNTAPSDGLRPLFLAPDRAPTEEGATPLSLRFERDAMGRPRLWLGFGRVQVVDARFADARLDLGLARGSLPLVFLGSSELGGFACPWPGAQQPVTDPEALVIERRGERATLVRGELRRDCDVPPERLGIAVGGGGAEPTVLSELAIERLPPD